MSLVIGTGITIGTGISITSEAATSPIVLSDLQLYLDAADVTSYSGSGTIWSDLSGNGNDVAMQNSGSISYTSSGGGYFTLASNGYFNRASTTGVPTGSSAYTMSVWVQWPTGTWPGSGGMIGVGSSTGGNQTNQFRCSTTNILIKYWGHQTLLKKEWPVLISI